MNIKLQVGMKFSDVISDFMEILRPIDRYVPVLTEIFHNTFELLGYSVIHISTSEFWLIWYLQNFRCGYEIWNVMYMSCIIALLLFLKTDGKLNTSNPSIGNNKQFFIFVNLRK